MDEPKKRVIVDGVDFRELFQFPRLIKAVVEAMQPPRLVVGVFVIILLMAGGRIWDGMTSPGVHPDGLLAGEITAQMRIRQQEVLRRAIRDYVPPDDWPDPDPQNWPALDARTVLMDVQRAYREQRDEELGREQLRRDDRAFFETVQRIHDVRPKGAFEASTALVTGSFVGIAEAVIFFQPRAVFERLVDLLVRMPVALWQQQKVFTIVFGLFYLIVVAIGGGALARMAACEIAGRERLRVSEAWKFSMTNWPRFVAAPLLPLLLAAALALVILLMGLLMTVPVLDVIGGLVYLIALVLGFLLAFLIIVYIVGFPLLIPAVAVENCDAADAQQRAYAYVLTRPLHMLGYVLLAVVGLALGYIVVALFATALLNFTAGSFGALTTNPAMSLAGGFSIFDLAPRDVGEFHPAWHNAAAAWLINLWQTLVIAIVAGYVVSYIFTAATTGYLLMRRACDGQNIEEIWRPGLVPGTLAPMPGASVEREAGRAEQAIGKAVRTATAARYGGQSKSDEADEAGRDRDEKQDQDEPGRPSGG